MRRPEIGTRPRISLPSHLFRRALHLMTALIVVYYLFPGTFIGVPKVYILIFIIGIVPAFIETFRLTRRKVLFGQRPHEDRALGSYAWSLWSSLIIMLVLPQEVALPIIVVYSLSDPVLGEIRVWRKDLVYPLGFTFTFVLFLAFGYNILLAAYATVFMLLGEASELQGFLRIRPELVRLYGRRGDEYSVPFKTDDDGTTQLVPALFVGILYAALPQIFPDPWFYPLSVLGG